MSKPKRGKGTLTQKDGEKSNQELKVDPKPSSPPTHENQEVGPNPPSTPTNGSGENQEEIVIMYPVEKTEIQEEPEKCPEKSQNNTTSNESPGLKAMLLQLMQDMITLSSNNLKGIIQETARDFQKEIEKVNTKLQENYKKMKTS